MKVLKSVQADFSAGDPYVKVVGFSHDGNLVVTGGEDGSVRTWKVRRFHFVPALVRLGGYVITGKALGTCVGSCN